MTFDTEQWDSNAIQTTITRTDAESLGKEYFEQNNAVLLPMHGQDEFYVVDDKLAEQVLFLFAQADEWQPILIEYLKEFPVADGTEIDLNMIKAATAWAIHRIKGDLNV